MAARKAEPGPRRARRAGRAGGRWRARRAGRAGGRWWARRAGPRQPDGREGGGGGGRGERAGAAPPWPSAGGRAGGAGRRASHAPPRQGERAGAQGPRHDGLAWLGAGRGERTSDQAGEAGGSRAVAPWPSAGRATPRTQGKIEVADQGWGTPRATEKKGGEKGEGKGEDGDELTSTIVAAAILHGREARRASCAR
jgi:hypothetical protein